MTPYYYEENGITIYNGDCLEIMKQFEDKSFDLVLTDPPYGVGIDYGNYQDTVENWRNLMLKAIPELRRISKMSILPCCQITELPFIYANFPPDWLICWYKGSPGTCAWVGFNDWEPLLVYGKNNGIQMHDYFSMANTEKMGNYGHPCPKPIRWAKWLIARATHEGDTILDPFMGSGTTLIAAKQLDRKAVGIEIIDKYCEIAKQRLEVTPVLLF